MEKLMESIESRIHTLVNTKYPKQQLLEYYISIQEKTISSTELIVAYYFALNDEIDISKIEEEVSSNRDLIYRYIEHIDDYFIRIDPNKYIFYLSPFESTPLYEARYRKVLIDIFKSIVSSNVNISGINKTNDKKVTVNISVKLDSSYIISEINKKYSILRKQYNKLFIAAQNEINALMELNNWLYKQMDNNKISYAPNDIINKIHDDEVIYNIYRVITCLNNDYFVHVYKEHEELARNNISYLRRIFKEFAGVSNIPQSCIKIISEHGDINSIINILNWLKTVKLNIIDFRSEDGIVALISTNDAALYSTYQLIQMGVITEDFVLKNPSILYDTDIIKNKNNGLYSSMVEKCNLLGQYNLNLNNTDIDEVLLLDINYIEGIIKQFNSYGLNNNSKISKNMFVNKRFFNYIDLFIELGLYDYIKNNFNIIGDDCDNIIKRIYVSKMMRLNIFDSNGELLPRVITGNGFYVANDALDNYIISVSNQMIDSNILKTLNNMDILDNSFNDEIDNFDKHFSIDIATYRFNDILISRNKVLRNYNWLRYNHPEYDRLSLLESSIIYGSILDIPNVYCIKDLFDEFYSSKQKKI